MVASFSILEEAADEIERLRFALGKQEVITGVYFEEIADKIEEWHEKD